MDVAPKATTDREEREENGNTKKILRTKSFLDEIKSIFHRFYIVFYGLSFGEKIK